jgi:integrase/recombinase XerD
MLTHYRRHKKNCKHSGKGRAHRGCSCPIWVDGVYNGIDVRQSLRVNTGEEAEREIERLKKRLTQDKGLSDGPATIAHAWNEFTSDAEARGLRPPTLNKYRYLRADMERFAASQGLRFISEFTLDQLRKWRASWLNRNLSALKKLELVRCFLRFAQDGGWIADNPARKLKSPKNHGTPHDAVHSSGDDQDPCRDGRVRRARLSLSTANQGSRAATPSFRPADRRCCHSVT